MMGNLARLLWRGLRLRCPVCGRGKLFRSWFHMHENCSYCGHHFEREEGYFVGAMALNLIVTELLLLVAVIAVIAAHVPLVPAILVGCVLGVACPLLFFPHARSCWMVLDLILHPIGS